MLSKNMISAVNEQINAELFSSYLYLSMAAHFAAGGLPGFENWMRVQVQEEMLHAIKFFDHVRERGSKVVLEAIAKPNSGWKSPLAVFEETLAHEQKVTALINNLVDIAQKEKDHASVNFLQWFISEQVEEESSAAAIVEKLKLIGKDTSGIFYLDRELALRVFNPAPAAA